MFINNNKRARKMTRDELRRRKNKLEEELIGLWCGI